MTESERELSKEIAAEIEEMEKDTKMQKRFKIGSRLTSVVCFEAKFK